MKKFLISSIILPILILASCAPAPTATIAPSETPTLVPTSTSTPTQTPESPLPTEAPAESDLRPAYTETITGELLGVQITTNLITDKSLDPTITAIKINPNYNNSEGKNSKDALTEFTARTFYKVWLKKGGVDGTGPKESVSFEDYMAMWAEAQNGTRPWEEMQITIKANDIATEGYKTEKTVIWPMYSGVAPEGVRAINEFDIAFVKTSKLTNITKLPNDPGGAGMGTNIDGHNLYIYVGLATDGSFGTAVQTSTQTASATIWMSSNRVQENRDLIKIITNKNGKSAIQIFPQNKTEKQYNP